MANSRKHPSALECIEGVGAVDTVHTVDTLATFDSVGDVDAIRLTVSQALAVIRPDRTFAIAYSGGVDSSVLLDAFVQVAGAERCLALHIHHGLSAHADQWQTHCQTQSAQRGVRFATANVDLSAYRGMGVEAAARLARYAALRDLADQHGAHVLVLGQHADDQAETVLLQMLRGAGLAGLSAMPAQRDISDVNLVDGSVALDLHVTDVEAALANASAERKTLPLIRPFLSVRRVQLEAYAQAEGLAWIEDESNQDVRFARNALRHDVLPVIEQHFPAYRQTLSRVARHAASAQSLFDDLAQIDFDRCLQLSDTPDLPAAQSVCLSRTALQSLSVERVSNLLRFWIRALGLRAASASRVEEMVVQLHGLRRRDVTVRLRHREQSAFGRLSIQHDGLVLHGYRDHVFWSAKGVDAATTPVIATGEVPAKHRATAATGVGSTRGALTPDDDMLAEDRDVDACYEGQACWQLAAWQGSLRVMTRQPTETDSAEADLLLTRSASSPSEPSATASVAPLAPPSASLSSDATQKRTQFVLTEAAFASGKLSARKRRGGERLSLGAGRPSRSLKHLFQEAGVPTWQRNVPLFYLDDALIFVPYLGGSVRAVPKSSAMDRNGDGPACRDVPQDEGQIVLEWLPW